MTIIFDQCLSSGRSQPVTEFIDSLFDRRKPAFIFDDIFHFSIRHHERHKQYKNMQPLVKWMIAHVLERMRGQDIKAIMVPEAITNGELYFDFAERNEKRVREARGGLLTTYRMAEILARDELNLLTAKNKNKAMERLDAIFKLFPEHLIVSPTGMEAFLKSAMKETGFTNNQSLRDEDFEGFWIAVCYLCQCGCFAGEAAYSRNGNFETFALFQTQYGVVPFRPQGDMDVYFPNGDPVSPADYLRMLYDHMLDVMPRGFVADLTVKMATRMMMLEEMRTTGMTHPYWGSLDVKKVNPRLMDLPIEHDDEFEELSSQILSLIQEYQHGQFLGDLFGFNADNQYDQLGEYYQKRLKAFNSRAIRPVIDIGSMRKKLSDWRENNLSVDRALSDKDALLTHRTPFQLDGSFFSAGLPLFEEAHYSRVPHSQKLALKACMGLLETPQKAVALDSGFKGEIVLLFDRRAGSKGRRYLDRHGHGLVIPDEARGLKDSFSSENYEEAVKNKNITQASRAFDRLRALYPDRMILSSENIENIADYYEHWRQAIRQEGPPKFKTEAKMALTEEIIARRGSLVVTDPFWVNSAYLTFSRLHARKIQLGLVSRPVNVPDYGIAVGDYHYKKDVAPKSFMDDLHALTKEMERLVDAKTENYPRHVVRV